MRIVRMQLGNEYSISPSIWPRPAGRCLDSRSNDLWFQHLAIVVRDMDQAFDKVRALKVQFVSTGPQTLPAIDSEPPPELRRLYSATRTDTIWRSSIFRPGKATRAGRRLTDKLFLGIDHTAIGISNTDASLKFYRDLLGLRKAGESENFGTEQEHLNQVFGAHLRDYYGCEQRTGPRLSFWNILRRETGDRVQADIHANDIVHWQTMIATDDLDVLAKKITRCPRSICFTRRDRDAKGQSRIF